MNDVVANELLIALATFWTALCRKLSRQLVLMNWSLWKMVQIIQYVLITNIILLTILI